MNIARWFAYTRQVERERDTALTRITALEGQLEARTSYAFALAGRPTPEIVKQREAAMVAGANQPGSLTPIRTSKSIRLLRREAADDVIAAREPKDGPLRKMEARADEFAERRKA